MEDGRNTYYKLLGDQIVKKFRTMPITKNVSFNGISFRCLNHNHIVNQQQEPTGPTFSEFLQFVVQHYKSGGRFDEHWSPIYQFCTPCSINFTLIAKMETFRRDSEYIIRQAGLETLLLNKVPKTKEQKIANRSAKNDTSSSIPKWVLERPQNQIETSLFIFTDTFRKSTKTCFSKSSTSTSSTLISSTMIALSITRWCKRTKQSVWSTSTIDLTLAMTRRSLGYLVRPIVGWESVWNKKRKRLAENWYFSKVFLYLPRTTKMKKNCV